MSLEIKVNEEGTDFSEEGHAGITVKFNPNVQYCGIENGDHILVRKAPYGTEHRTTFPLPCIAQITQEDDGLSLLFTEQVLFHGKTPDDSKLYPGLCFSYNTERLSIPFQYIKNVQNRDNAFLVCIQEEDKFL